MPTSFQEKLAWISLRSGSHSPTQLARNASAEEISKARRGQLGGQFGRRAGGRSTTRMLRCVAAPSVHQSVGAGEDKLPEERLESKESFPFPASSRWT